MGLILGRGIRSLLDFIGECVNFMGMIIERDRLVSVRFFM